jgi:hypothetical protein
MRVLTIRCHLCGISFLLNVTMVIFTEMKFIISLISKEEKRDRINFLTHLPLISKVNKIKIIVAFFLSHEFMFVCVLSHSLLFFIKIFHRVHTFNTGASPFISSSLPHSLSVLYVDCFFNREVGVGDFVLFFFFYMHIHVHIYSYERHINQFLKNFHLFCFFFFSHLIGESHIYDSKTYNHLNYYRRSSLKRKNKKGKNNF